MQSRGCGLEPKKAHIERPIAALGLDNSTIIFNRYVISSVSPRRWKNKRRVLLWKTASILNSIFQRKQDFWGSNWYNSIVESTQYRKKRPKMTLFCDIGQYRNKFCCDIVLYRTPRARDKRTIFEILRT